MNRYSLSYAVALFFTLPFVFLTSIWISSLYVGGDQVYYIAIYDALPQLGLIEGFEYYNKMVSSLEPIHYFFSWVFSHVVSKDYFVAASNVFLAHSALLWCKRRGVGVFVAILFVTTNFYFLVMYFAAERLKFGMIFFLYSLCFLESYKKTSTLAFLAVLSHVQMFVFYAAIVAGYYGEELYKVITKGRLSFNVFAVLILGAVMVFVMHDQLAKKVAAYYSVRDFSEIVKIIAFFLGALFYTNKKKAVVAIFLFLIVAVFLFGGQRINMIGFFVFLYCALGHKGGRNLGVYIVLIYFSLASYSFVLDVVEHGNGFHEAQIRKKD